MLIRGSKNITSTYQLDGKALLTTSLNQQDCNFLVERRYDNLNARLHAFKNRRWESVLDMIRESGHLQNLTDCNLVLRPEHCPAFRSHG